MSPRVMRECYFLNERTLQGRLRKLSFTACRVNKSNSGLALQAEIPGGSEASDAASGSLACLWHYVKTR